MFLEKQEQLNTKTKLKMGAKNQDSTGGAEYYKLKEEKIGSAGTGILWFWKQEKQNGAWGDGEKFNSMSGHVTGLELKDFMFEGKPKKSLTVKLRCNDTGNSIQFQLGFPNALSTQIVNTLMAEDLSKPLYFNCGSKPNHQNGKDYPTFYINKEGGERTNWKYSTQAGTWDLIPKITKTYDEDGNEIKKGQKANTEFWVNAVLELQKIIEGAGLDKSGAPANNTKPVSDNKNFENEGPRKQAESAQPKSFVKSAEDDDLPF